MSRLRRRHFGLQGQRRRQPRDRLGRPRRDCPDLACAATSFPPRADGQRAASMTSCSSATGTRGPSPASSRASSPSRSSSGKLTGAGAPRHRRAGRRHAVQAVRRRRGNRLSRRRPHGLFRAARGGADRADLDQPRHLRGARRRLAPRRSTSPTPTTAPTRCRRCRPTAARWPMSRWRAPATRPTAR